jgi:hypothetical protein
MIRNRLKGFFAVTLRHGFICDCPRCALEAAWGSAVANLNFESSFNYREKLDCVVDSVDGFAGSSAPDVLPPGIAYSDLRWLANQAQEEGRYEAGRCR